MNPPCVAVMGKILLDLRIRVTHHLVQNGFSQTDIARQLHISQAMVSKYLSQDPPESGKDFEDVAEELARMMIQEKNEQDIILFLCEACFRWREGGITCDRHGLKDCTVCTHLRNPRITHEKQRVIEKISDALLILQEDSSIIQMMPEVRMNVAMALEKCTTPMDVAAVPGRLIPVHGTVIAVSAPEFGASHHLASILISSRKKAVINIRYSDAIHEAINKSNLEISTSPGEPGDVLVDRGGFGIEPCAYVFGDDAVDAALRVQMIAELLQSP